MPGLPGMSARNAQFRNELRRTRVLLAPAGKSARFSCRFNDLHPSLILRACEQDSAQVAQKIRADDPKRLLRDVPGKIRERRGQREGIYGDPSLVGDTPPLQTVGRKVVTIPPAPRGLRSPAPRRLAGRC